MEKHPVDKEKISAAYQRIRDHIHQTPVLTSKTLDKLSGAKLFFKCENFQKVGAFKARGAVNAVLSLSSEVLKNGVATHSSGNHAQALAYAASLVKVPAYIVMPDNATKVKMAAVEGYGAKIITCEPKQKARESTLNQIIEDTGAVLVHPYDDYQVMAGQATCAYELIREIQDLDMIIAPVGGGGLLSGTALSAHYFGDNIKVYGAEPAGADDAKRSFDSGERVKEQKPNTIADGLLTTLGEKTFPVINDLVEDILVADDEEIIEAMRLIWERMKIIVEPSCAVPLAAILKNKELFKGKNIGVILTGGNVDLENLPFKK